MTFILSHVTQNGIFMASDSSETHTDAYGKETYKEVDKTLYFKNINIGISTWGDAQVGNQGINEWLEQTIKDFTINHSDRILEKITLYLADKLDQAFGLDGKRINNFIHMGLHVAGYNSVSKDILPGITHVFIERGFKKFDPQMTMPSLPDRNSTYQLRNGMYEEFAIMWPALSGIDAAFRNLIAEHYKNDIKPNADPNALYAEWLGSWVKQISLIIKTAGLPEYIGMTVKILAFDNKGHARWFYLPKMETKSVS